VLAFLYFYVNLLLMNEDRSHEGKQTGISRRKLFKASLGIGAGIAFSGCGLNQRQETFPPINPGEKIKDTIEKLLYPVIKSAHAYADRYLAPMAKMPALGEPISRGYDNWQGGSYTSSMAIITQTYLPPSDYDCSTTYAFNFYSTPLEAGTNPEPTAQIFTQWSTTENPEGEALYGKILGGKASYADIASARNDTAESHNQTQGKGIRLELVRVITNDGIQYDLIFSTESLNPTVTHYDSNGTSQRFTETTGGYEGVLNDAISSTKKVFEQVKNASDMP
jgi:hypothetical protein